MDAYRLPPHLAQWRGADAAVAAVDVPVLRRQAGDLVDLVLAEDTRFLDALPERIESAIVTPLSILSHALDHGTDVEVLVAARLVRSCVEGLHTERIPELHRLLIRLPDTPSSPPPARPGDSGRCDGSS